VTGQAVVWFRRDLRLTDNPAWAAATEAADHVTALYVLDPVVLATAGEFRRTQLFSHLHGLDRSLAQLGGRLLVRAGDPARVVPDVARGCGASLVCVNADVTAYARRRDRRVGERLGGAFQQWWGNLVHAPGTVVTAQGTTARVFTAFATRWQQLPHSTWPDGGTATVADHAGDGLATPEAEPFQPGGEAAALDRLRDFGHRVDAYERTRDIPATMGTSVLSADLHFGTLSPRTVASVIGTATSGRAAFVRQLAWRDWFAHLWWERPTLTEQALRPEMDRIRWVNDPADIEAWQQGRTGYPLVDAGMRQLATTGWMHNRVRMVAASFLVKDLLVDWRIGERWFRRLLVDGDITQNAGNWQWVAGTGPDAAPYFRVFNPVLQSRKFDPEGIYITTFVPELAALPPRWVHSPWTAPPLELAGGGVILGDAYPHPIIDHGFARGRALAAYHAATRGQSD
jgi:deoxyribodipyrimidine photo-lyase